MAPATKRSAVSFSDMLGSTWPPWLLAEYCAYLGLFGYLIYTELLPWLTETAPNACRGSERCARDMNSDIAWFPGGSVDVSDDQMRRFRQGFLLLGTFAVVHAAVSQGLRVCTFSFGFPRLQLLGHAAIGLVFIFYLHGWQAVIPVSAAFFCWCLSVVAFLSPPSVRSIGLPAAVWLGTIGLRIVAEVIRDRISLEWVSSGVCANLLGAPCLEAVHSLTQYSGMVGWHTTFPLLMLRCISFVCDAAWAQGEERGASSSGKRSAEQVGPASLQVSGGSSSGMSSAARSRNTASASLSESQPTLVKPRSRPRSASVVLASTPLPEAAYMQPEAVLAYLFFPPLYLSGPTITFNSFMSQMRTSQPMKGTSYVVLYAIRFLFCGLLLELILEFVPVFGLINHKPFQSLDATAFAGIGLVSLFVLWLKFLVIWRFARLWSLFAGLNPPENMKRCVYNNYSVQGFWRGWHCSYNRWVLRYVYFPLGGGRQGLLRRLVNIAIVFTFVALWHDMNPKLLTWGWLIAVAFAPELVCAWYTARPESSWLTRSRWFRWVGGAAATLQVLGLIIANVIGFAVGPKGTMALIHGMTGHGGHQSRRHGSGGRPPADPLWVIVGAFAVLFAGVQWMFLVRALEEGWRPWGSSSGVRPKQDTREVANQAVSAARREGGPRERREGAQQRHGAD